MYCYSLIRFIMTVHMGLTTRLEAGGASENKTAEPACQQR